MALLMTDEDGNWDIDVISHKAGSEREVENTMWRIIKDLDLKERKSEKIE